MFCLRFPVLQLCSLLSVTKARAPACPRSLCGRRCGRASAGCGGAGGKTWSAGSVLRGKPCRVRFRLCSSLFCLWAAQGRMLFGFRAWLVCLFAIFVSTVMLLSREVPFSVLGRSQQRGKTIIQTEDSAVEGRGPKAAGLGCLHPGQGWRARGWVFLWRSGRGRGLAQEGISGMVQRMQVERARRRRRARGQAPWPGPCHRVDSRDESRMSS